MRVNIDLKSDICLDPIISLRSDPRPLTLEVICLHGAVIYQQGREIALPITHSTGAPPEMHRFDAMRIKVDGAQKVCSDWKAGSMKDFDKTSNVSYCVFICS